MELISAKENDIIELSTWFKNEDEIKSWGGPMVRFPFTIEEFKKDIGWNIITSYSLFKDDELIGFVQLFDKFGCAHIGRVIIKPNKRAIGLGAKLIQTLFKQNINIKKDYTLFVYKDNISAINLYKKLGFKISSSSTKYENENNCFFMKKQS